MDLLLKGVSNFEIRTFCCIMQIQNITLSPCIDDDGHCNGLLFRCSWDIIALNLEIDSEMPPLLKKRKKCVF